MREISREIIKYKLTGQGSGTGYIFYFDDYTHDACIDIYKDGERVKQYRIPDGEDYKELLENVKNSEC